MSPIQPYKTLYKSSNLSNLENVPRFGKTGPGLPIAGGGDGGCCGGGVVDDAVDDVVAGGGGGDGGGGVVGGGRACAGSERRGPRRSRRGRHRAPQTAARNSSWRPLRSGRATATERPVGTKSCAISVGPLERRRDTRTAAVGFARIASETKKKHATADDKSEVNHGAVPIRFEKKQQQQQSKQTKPERSTETQRATSAG